jgi:DNA-binding CsgD family transcriptional regulator
MATEREREIIQAMADGNLNISEAARILFMSRNNVEYHVEKIKKHYGLDCRKFYDLIKLLEMAGNPF